ncbi:pyrimidine-nucleoside phosphorylase [Spiroplasma eriocheiris]|uniref:Thymidine phosphorylase n=1 Tax=Spiroplasma eriocheiris TaxID=315358 RepID=A0A0H3XHY9_9MOLU|nr:pyrimidine-nucleoside phosphorylase [Spiroplasma eriocheiris]AHF57583.1 pyrimidine-nucleoside phosphorylase [Spiroplasma eriocheiris CCTCC M 207170]AKM54040.1 thymidine phosphorylase [Spiroplasma eriocheiris]
MRLLDLIEKKKNGQELTQEEIKFIIEGYTTGAIPDYQMSAFLMAVFFQSMSITEISYLTDAMIQSGEVYDLSGIRGFKVDKHSSGGVGDKVSLIYAPLVASFGLKVAKMSGRGLGQTGGTIDKLESFPGFKVEISFAEFVRIVNKTNISIIAQSSNIVPADKKIYALRDVTATVNSIPLIAASIMCKKIATGSDGIVLDVKCGNGAFMKSISEAKQLAEIMVGIGKHFDKKIAAEITNMNQPLGRAIGNAIEIYEVVKTLQGEGPEDLNYIVCESAALSLCQANLFPDFESAFKACQDKLHNSPEPLTYFKNFIQEQGGDLSLISDLHSLDQMLKVKNKVEIRAKETGFIEIVDTNALGLLSVRLGAGRNTKEEEIDHHAGIYLNKKTGEFVNEGETVMTLYTNRYVTDPVYEWAESTFKITDKEPKAYELVYEVIQ